MRVVEVALITGRLSAASFIASAVFVTSGCTRGDTDLCTVRSYRTAEQAVESIQKLSTRSPAMDEAYQNQLNDCVDLEAAALRRSHDPAELVAKVVVTECQGFTIMPRNASVQRAIQAASQANDSVPTYEKSSEAFDEDLYKASLTRVVAWRAKRCSKLDET